MMSLFTSISINDLNILYSFLFSLNTNHQPFEKKSLQFDSQIHIDRHDQKLMMLVDIHLLNHYCMLAKYLLQHAQSVEFDCSLKTELQKFKKILVLLGPLLIQRRLNGRKRTDEIKLQMRKIILNDTELF